VGFPQILSVEAAQGLPVQSHLLEKLLLHGNPSFPGKRF